jgi:hypothetical protein
MTMMYASTVKTGLVLRGAIVGQGCPLTHAGRLNAAIGQNH